MDTGDLPLDRRIKVIFTLSNGRLGYTRVCSA
jgi:hypothetical protein